MGSTTNRSPLRVLVIDDCSDTSIRLAVLLESWGYLARTADNGDQALAEAKDFLPNVVLLDLILPDMSGFEIANRLCDGAGLKREQFVVITGFAHHEARTLCQEQGLRHFLAKPVDLEELRRVLMTWPI
jgi:CheY-like chemotaxis protein